MPKAVQSKSHFSLRASRRLRNYADATKLWLGLKLQDGTQRGLNFNSKLVETPSSDLAANFLTSTSSGAENLT